jgi:phage baseplate assembly protein W
LADIEKFFQTIPGRKSVIKDIDATLGSQGDFNEISDINVLIRSIGNLLLTSRGTYIGDPEYGCNLYKYIYEPADNITMQDIYMELERSIKRYETRGDISYNVIFFSNKKGFIVNLYISYYGEKKKISVKIDESLLSSTSK